ncbi:MAG: hypothetical protein RIK87_30315 [Fuerstiella sp.]
MTSLLRMSDEELAAYEAEQRFARGSAIGVSLTASGLAFGSMALRYSPGDAVPIVGMDHITGQLLLSAALGLTMLTAAWLIRGAIMKRLQWAVLLSLALHLLICIGLRTVSVNIPLAMVEVGSTDRLPEEFSVPDYGGAEAQQTEPQEWERPSNVEAQESEQHEVQRQSADVTPQAEPEAIDVERQVETTVVPERQQQQERMKQAQELQLQRQNRQAQSYAPDQLEAPEVETAQVRQPQLNAEQMQRQQADPRNSQRQLEQLESQVASQVSMSHIDARPEVQPRDVLQLSVEQRLRDAAEARPADTQAEAVSMNTAPEAPQVTTDAPTMLATRQTESALVAPTRNDLTSPATVAEMQVRQLNPSRAGAADVAVSAPSGGGQIPLQRHTSTVGRSPSAAGTTAPSVAVSSAAASGSPALQATTSAAVSRGGVSMPDGTAGSGGAPAMNLSQFGVAALQSGTGGRGRAAGTGPQLGESVTAPFPGGSGTRGSAEGLPGAAGTRAQEVVVSRVAGGGGTSEQILAAGPSSAASGIGRTGTGVPANPRSGPGAGSDVGSAADSSSRSASGSSNGVSGDRPAVAMTTAGRSGLSAGSTTPSASPGEIVAGRRALSDSGRSARGTAEINLPAGAWQAEQSGALVMAGPQAPVGERGNGNPGLSEPRIADLPRRAAGLPGTVRASTAVSRTQAGLPGSFTSSPLRAGPASGAVRPKLATASEVAGLIRRRVPGLSDIPTERISAAFSMRIPEARAEAVEKLGGSEQSEAAVDRGLEWLAAHQYAAGNWSIHEMHCRDHDCGGHGSYEADPAATGLALLAFLGAGHTHRSGDYRTEVSRGLDWLMNNQAKDGDLFNADTEFARFYSHGIAAIALCEAYGMTKDPRLEGAAQRALDFIAASQHPKFGGWRYQAKFESDTSVSGWQLMALKSGEMAGLRVPGQVYNGVRTWLNSVEDRDAPGRFAYHPTKEVTEVMTAEGLLMRQYLGADRTDPGLQAGAAYLRQRLPRTDSRNAYYWYYATQVMFHMQGSDWDAWNAGLRDLLVDTQQKGGPARGSWDPDAPTKDTWGRSGGRHYVTCLNLLMLEVYYRHLPLYIDLTP